MRGVKKPGALALGAALLVLVALSPAAHATSSAGKPGALSCTGTKQAFVATNTARDRLSVVVNGAGTVFIGDDSAAALTSATGYPVTSSLPWQSGQGFTSPMSCITTGAAVDLRFLEEAR